MSIYIGKNRNLEDRLKALEIENASCFLCFSNFLFRICNITFDIILIQHKG